MAYVSRCRPVTPSLSTCFNLGPWSAQGQILRPCLRNLSPVSAINIYCGSDQKRLKILNTYLPWSGVGQIPDGLTLKIKVTELVLKIIGNSVLSSIIVSVSFQTKRNCSLPLDLFWPVVIKPVLFRIYYMCARCFYQLVTCVDIFGSHRIPGYIEAPPHPFGF